MDYTALVGVVLGFFLSYGVEWWKNRRSIKGYSAILHLELMTLKEDRPGGLDSVLGSYYNVCNLVEDGIYADLLSEDQDPDEILERRSFRQKYTFLRNNFDKVSLFKADTIKSILKVYSYMEEYDEFRTRTPKLLLVENLLKAQKEIPNTLLLLEKEN
jgi:hypothetical protein